MNKQNFFSVSDPRKDFTRDMYRDSNRQRVEPDTPKKRPHVNELLPTNHRNDLRNKERTIRDLNEEIKGLKEKLSMVIEKDQEIYRLQCENDILQREISEYRSIKTDDELKDQNDQYCTQIIDLESMIDSLKNENITLKKKLIELYHSHQKSQDQPIITDEMIGRYLRSLLSYRNTQSLLTGIL